MKMVGLCGAAGAGKDTAAAELIENHDFVRFAFADPMKEAVLALNPWVQDEMGSFHRLEDVIEDIGWQEAKHWPDVRLLLQRFGTEMGRRVFGENFWVELTMSKIKERCLSGDELPGGIVITDVRFANEAEAVNKNFGYVIEVQRPGVENFAGVHAGHESEVRDFTVDGFVVNDSTPAVLGERLAAKLWSGEG